MRNKPKRSSFIIDHPLIAAALCFLGGIAVCYGIYRAGVKRDLYTAASFERTSPANGDITYTLNVKPYASMAIRGYEASIRFDPSIAQATKIEYRLGVVSQGLGDDSSEINIVNAKGMIHIMGEIQTADGASVKSDKPTGLVTISFRRRGSSQTKLSVDPGKIVLFRINQDHTLSKVLTESQVSTPIGKQ